MKWTHGLSCSIPSSTGHKCTSKNMEDGPDEPTETTTFTSSTNCVGLHCHGEGSYLVTERFGCWNSTWEDAGTTTVRKWKWLLVNGCECTSLISTVRNFLISCQSGTNTSVCLGVHQEMILWGNRWAMLYMVT